MSYSSHTANISAAKPFSNTHSLSLSLPLSHSSIHCPQQKPTQLPRLPISHKGTMLAQPTARRWGVVRRESSFHVDRGCSHTGTIFHACLSGCLCSAVRAAAVRAEIGSGQVFWKFCFKSRKSRFCRRAGGQSTRPRQGDTASSAESAGRVLCNLSHEHTHSLTHTQTD